MVERERKISTKAKVVRGISLVAFAAAAAGCEARGLRDEEGNLFPTQPYTTQPTEVPTAFPEPTSFAEVEPESTPEAPRPGAEDEMSIAIKDYLNENYSELGIYGVEQVGKSVSVSGGELFNFAIANVENEHVQGKRLPLLALLNKDGTVNSVMLLVRSEEPSVADYLIKYEFVGYRFNPETNQLVNYGPTVQRSKIGEFKLKWGGEWKDVLSPADRHKEPLKALLTDEDYFNPTLWYEITEPEPMPTEELPEIPPLIQPESLAIPLDVETLNLITRINPENLYQPPQGPDPNLHVTEIAAYYGKADELIRAMGVQENQMLKDQYIKFFNENWIVSYDEYRYQDMSYDIRGLGAETIYFKGPQGEGLGHSQAVGFLYGFTGDHVILQIKLGSNLTPEEDPEAFIAVEIQRSNEKTEGLVGLLSFDEHGRSYQRYIQKEGYSVPWFRYWSPAELQKSLNLLRGSIAITKGRQGNELGTYEADMIYFFVPEIPSEEGQIENGYKLYKFNGW